VLKLLPDSMLLASNHGRRVWNLKGSRESGSASTRTDSGTEQCAPTLTATARNQCAFHLLPDSALGKPIVAPVELHSAGVLPTPCLRLRPPSKF
jgi:hypothetical protein